jgi:hypothetical protein
MRALGSGAMTALNILAAACFAVWCSVFVWVTMEAFTGWGRVLQMETFITVKVCGTLFCLEDSWSAVLMGGRSAASDSTGR